MPGAQGSLDINVVISHGCHLHYFSWQDLGFLFSQTGTVSMTGVDLDSTSMPREISAAPWGFFCPKRVLVSFFGLAGPSRRDCNIWKSACPARRVRAERALTHFLLAWERNKFQAWLSPTCSSTQSVHSAIYRGAMRLRAHLVARRAGFLCLQCT